MKKIPDHEKQENNEQEKQKTTIRKRTIKLFKPL
jgi:hypothetical protein